MTHSLASALCFLITLSAHSALAEEPTWPEGLYSNNEQVWQAAEDKGASKPHWEFVFEPLADGVALHMTNHAKSAVYKFLIRHSDAGHAVIESEQGECRADLTHNPKQSPFVMSLDFDPTPCGWPITDAPGRQRLQLSETRLLTGAISDSKLDTRFFGRSKGVAARKARRFGGWFVIDESELEGKAAESEAVFVRGLNLHTEGDRNELILPNGESAGIEVELAQLTYQNTGAAILKLALYRKGESRAFTYVWTSTDADRIGINLRWLQVGL
jgi:hypothetical protein